MQYIIVKRCIGVKLKHNVPRSSEHHNMHVQSNIPTMFVTQIYSLKKMKNVCTW